MLAIAVILVEDQENSGVSKETVEFSGKLKRIVTVISSVSKNG